MKVFKSINNNIVSAIDENGRELVVIGKGIGYKAREGAIIPREKIIKIFVMDGHDNLNKLKDLFSHLQKEYIEITDDILTYAKGHLNKDLNESAYFTLADHIGFAISRMREGMLFDNILLTEVKRFYPKEFEVGLYAIKQIKEKIDIDMPEGEAASIALHILNAVYYTSVSDAFKGTQMLGWIIDRVMQHTGIETDTNSHYGERFVVHLKYLVQRIIHKEPSSYTDDGIYSLMESLCKDKLLECEKIAEDIWAAHNYRLTKHELACMAMHIRRISL